MNTDTSYVSVFIDGDQRPFHYTIAPRLSPTADSRQVSVTQPRGKFATQQVQRLQSRDFHPWSAPASLAQSTAQRRRRNRYHSRLRLRCERFWNSPTCGHVPVTRGRPDSRWGVSSFHLISELLLQKRGVAVYGKRFLHSTSTSYKLQFTRC